MVFVSLFVFVLVAVATVVPVVVLALTPRVAGHDPLPKPPTLQQSPLPVPSVMCRMDVPP